jgi:hypothetical protein
MKDDFFHLYGLTPSYSTTNISLKLDAPACRMKSAAIHFQQTHAAIRHDKGPFNEQETKEI